MVSLFRFRENVFLLQNPSFLQRCIFYIFGHDFIGTEIRLAHFRHALRKIPFFSNVLDAGCGTGDFSFYVAHKFKNVSIDAMDIDKKRIAENNKVKVTLHISNINFFEGDILKIAEEQKEHNKQKKKWKNSYDLVFCIGTILYFTKEQRLRIAKNLLSLVKPNSYIYFDLPISDYTDLTLISPKYYPNMYKMIEAKNTGDLFGFEELEKLLKNNNFTIIHKNKTHNCLGKFAWEFDNVLRERNYNRVRLFLLPLMRAMARSDAWTKNRRGCCFCILAKKGDDVVMNKKSA